MPDATHDQLPPGPLRDLLSELHELRRRAGDPGGRKIEAAMSGNKASHTTILAMLKRAELPKRPLLLRVVEALAKIAELSDPIATRIRFESLWTMADSGLIEPSGSFEYEPFRIGPIRTSTLIVEGDGELTLARGDVRLIVRPEMVDVPPEVALWKEEIASEQAARKENGLKPRWNGPNYAVAGVSISRDELTESSQVAIHLQHSDFFTFLASQQLDRELSNGETLRSKFLTGKPWSETPAFISSSFGINVSITTADNYILFSKRSADVSSQPNVWNSSVNEGLSRGLDSTGAQPPDLYRVAERALKEEAAVDDTEVEVQMLAVTLDLFLHHWGGAFWARCKDLTASQLRERLSRGVQDGWEHGSHNFVRFRVREVLEFLLRISGECSPMVPVLYYLTLVRRFGRAEVERIASQVIAERGLGN